MNKAKETRMNFIQRLYKSIADFDIFSRFIEEPLGAAIKYLAIVVVIYSILVTTVYVIKINKEIEEGVNYLKNNIDAISINNNLFSYNNDEEAIYEDENKLIPIIIVNTGDDPAVSEYKNKVKLYDYGFIILKDKILINASGLDEFETVELNEFNIESMSKDEILLNLQDKTVYILLSIIFLVANFIQYFIYTLFLAIILSIVGQIVSLVLRLRMSFKSTYIIGIYALTLPTVLNIFYVLINSMTGFVIQHFNWMYTTISYIYVCVAILMIKTDFINIKKEMIKIKLIEEQEKANKEEEKETEEENKDNNDDNNNKEDNEDDKDNELKEQTDS